MQYNIYDIVSAGLIITALLMIPKNYKWWLLYAFGGFFYIFIRWSVGMYGGAILEILAVTIGIRNYRYYKKLNNKNTMPNLLKKIKKTEYEFKRLY